MIAFIKQHMTLRRTARLWAIFVCPTACFVAVVAGRIHAAEITALLSFIAGLHLLHEKGDKTDADSSDT